MTIDATFWVAVSFLIFVGVIFYFKVPQRIDDSLNESIKKIKVMPLSSFFIDYRKTRLKAGQFIDSIRIPLFPKNIFRAYKISKRFDDDISSVCASFNVQLINKKIKNINIVDITGKSVFSTSQFHNKNGMITITLKKESLSSGLYYGTLETDGGKHIFKLTYIQ